jgi:CBS domain-containing protein
MLIRHYMSPVPLACRPGERVRQAFGMAIRRASCHVFVIDDNRQLIGIARVRDLALALADRDGPGGERGLLAVTAVGWPEVDADEDVTVAAEVFERHADLNVLPVTAGGRLAGVIQRTDLVRTNGESARRPRLPQVLH